jgi:hypothetical protein
MPELPELPDPVVLDCARHLADDLTPEERLRRQQAEREEKLKDLTLDKSIEEAA